ncbi:conserved hypothetical protein [Magnetospirillum sp. LM-5]|nr:conserved hypothetical protein [Magnetospirillum sp. LM-5]
MCPQAVSEGDRAVAVSPAVRPATSWRIAAVRPLADYRIWVRFNDGREGVVDMADLVNSPEAGLFSSLTDTALFDRAFLLHGAVTWPNGLDLAPDALYDLLKGRTECRLSP